MNPLFCIPGEHRVAGSRSWGRVQSATLMPLGQARGQREFLCFRPGFYVAMNELEHLEDRRDTYPSGDFFKLHFRLAGRSRVAQVSAAGSQQIAPGSVTTLVQPRNSFKEEHFAAGEAERSVTVCCSRDFLTAELGLDATAGAAGPLDDYLHDTRSRFELIQAPMQAEQQSVATALMDCRPTDPYRALFAEAKAIELLHSFLARSPDAATGRPGRATALQERMAVVKRYVDTHLGDALDMQSLAKRFGMSESRLARHFRAVFGVPVFEYIGQLRLERARKLLEDGQMRVTDVAFSVGYNHVANFSTAFRRCYGVSPQALRKSGARTPSAAAAS